MATESLNLVAVVVFGFTLAILVGPWLHLSPLATASAAFLLLGLTTVDQLGWSGQGTRLLLDRWRNLSATHRRRVAHHEAGHLLVAHALGVGVEDYTLNAWTAWKRGYPPGEAGVRFTGLVLEPGASLSASTLERYATVWLAGIAAEHMVYGDAQGGDGDLAQVRALVAQLRPAVPPPQQILRERLAMRRAQAILKARWATYETLVEALLEGAPLETCLALLGRESP